MDALSDVLRVVRLKGGVFLHAEFTAPWCISSLVRIELRRSAQARPGADDGIQRESANAAGCITLLTTCWPILPPMSWPT
jgi:Cupin